MESMDKNPLMTTVFAPSLENKCGLNYGTLGLNKKKK